MVTDDDVLESEDTHIFERIKEFVSIEAVVGFAAAKQLMVHIERAVRQGLAIAMFNANAFQQKRGDVTKVTPSTPSGTPPASIIPKSKEKLKMSDIDPLEMARQLTLMENRLYTKIRPIECLQRSRDVKSDTADNISSVIQFSNRVSFFSFSHLPHLIRFFNNFRFQSGLKIPYWLKKILAGALEC